jgi:ligand-binding SRPBCC domain-containing protein
VVDDVRRDLEREMRIELPPEEVFEFFADAFNLQKITPPDVRFRVLTLAPIELRKGARIDYRLTVFRVPFRWRTVFTLWEPPVRFVDEQERGPYRSWIHSHEFSDFGGVTVVRDRVQYELRWPPLGELAHPMVRRKLDQIFDFRQAEIRRLLSRE